MRKGKIALVVLVFTLGGVFAALCLKVERHKRLKLIVKAPSTFSEVERVDCNSVKPVIYRRVPCLAKLPAKKRKRIFIDILLPSILVKNYRIELLRERIAKLKKKLDSGKRLSEEEQRFLKELSRKYRATTVEELLYKIAPIPAGLAIAQAAIESGWGSSRFFCEANNLFGEWSFSKRGVKAKKAEVYLKKFSSILEAVDSYYYNLNTGWAYEGFRLARKRKPESLHLVKYLEKYSILGEEYIGRLEKIIRENHLDSYDHCRIDPRYIDTEWHLSFRCSLR